MFIAIPELDQIAAGNVAVTVEEGDGFTAEMLFDDDAMLRYVANKLFS